MAKTVIQIVKDRKGPFDPTLRIEIDALRGRLGRADKKALESLPTVGRVALISKGAAIMIRDDEPIFEKFEEEVLRFLENRFTVETVREVSLAQGKNKKR
jgi:hypothetical protein